MDAVIWFENNTAVLGGDVCFMEAILTPASYVKLSICPSMNSADSSGYFAKTEHAILNESELFNLIFNYSHQSRLPVISSDPNAVCSVTVN